ncbi:MAG: alpha-amylase family glycosyl hydrolase [Candidatus Neomarinimicrobiota bacterium]
MKNLACILCLITVFAYAQSPLSSEPPIPMQHDSILVFFDATKGKQGLKDYSGDIYAHTGVNDWKYVWTDWPSTNTEKNKLTKVSDNLYKLVIGYPHDYYSCPESVDIYQLAFVFRNSTGSAQSEDLFLTLYEGGLTAAIFEPVASLEYEKAERSPIFRSIDNSSPLSVVAGASEIADNIKLFLNDSEQKTVNNTDELTHSIQASSLILGRNYLYSVASKGAEQDTSDLVCIVKYDHNIAALPSGIEMGIDVAPDNIQFALFAPAKDFVHLIGDFNDWEVDPDYQMLKYEPAPDSTVFFLTLSNDFDSSLAFQYLVDGEIRIADPYSKLILDPWNDKYISPLVYPDLKVYPEGKTDFPVAVVDPNPTEFNWTDDDYVKPLKDNLVIYELLLRDWSYQHSYQSLMDSLNYFKKLGITAIELMPVSEFEGNESWGYNPSFYFALDKYYGTAQKFKEFVNLFHNHGIAVILDVVYNHATGQNPMVRLYNEGDYGAPTANNPWFNTEAKHPFNVFYDANHESVHTKYMLDRANKFWIEEYHIDGFRFDLSKGFTQKNSGDNVGYWGNYDASRVAILKRMADVVWSVDPSAYIILEHFADNNEEIDLANYGMMLWGNANHNYSEASMGYLPSSDLGGVYHANRNWSWRHLVGYMESHDEERITFRNKEYGNSSGAYNIKIQGTALDRMELAAVFLLSYPGPKMIWQFGELGYSYSIDYNDRTGKKPIKWDYFKDPDRHDVYELYSAMNFLRAEYPVFSAANSVDQWVAGNIGSKRLKLSEGTINAVVLGNFDVTTQTATPAFHNTGTWYEYFTRQSINVSDVNAGISLAPGEYRIYTNQELKTPPVALDNIVPIAFELKQNYPNPFNPVTTIDYILTRDGAVTLDIYDLAGHRVMALVNEYQSAGNYSKKLDASGLASGIYMYKLTSGRHAHARKMLLMK